MPTWILVADNCRARIFVAEKAAGPITEIRTLASPEGRLHEGDLVSDKGGRDRNPSAGAHGFSVGAEHKQDNAERFAAQVCEEARRRATRAHSRSSMSWPRQPSSGCCANTSRAP